MSCIVYDGMVVVKNVVCLQVPVTIEVEVPNELHRLLAGQKRRELMQTYDVHILLPPNDDTSDLVKVCLMRSRRTKKYFVRCGTALAYL